MDKNLILNTVNEIFKNLFEDSSLQIDMNTTSEDVDGWDSLSNLQLLTQIQKEFNIKFSLMETISFGTVGDIVNVIYNKLNN